MNDLEKSGARDSGALGRTVTSLKVSHLAIIREIFAQPVNLIRSTLIGLWIGILPAVGGSAANILAYDQAKKGSKYPEKFGTGIPDGIIASESSNNANVGGSLITMMAFGIPGDAVTAVMLGALIIHGIQPGPFFVTTNAPIAYGMFAAYFLAHPLMLIIEALFIRFALRVVNLRLHILAPVVLVLCVVGSYALNNIIENVWTFFIFGVVGYLMVKTGFPLAPLILGVILGDQIEIELHPGHDDRRRLDPLLHQAVVGPYVGAIGPVFRLLPLAAASGCQARRRAARGGGGGRRDVIVPDPYECIPALAITKKAGSYQKP